MRVKNLLIIAATCLLIGCGGSGSKKPQFPSSDDAPANKSETIGVVNDQLRLQGGEIPSREYRLGPGDIINVLVYLVEDVSRDYHVNSKGQIQMPLIGAVNVGGLTVVEAQNEISKLLAENYLRDPQVTISVTEYSANEVSVLGEVEKPNFYKIKEGRNPFEMLILAGGLKDSAGGSMHITAKKRNDRGEYVQYKTIIDIKTLFQPQTPEDYRVLQETRDIILSNGDSVYIPAAGVVYIDGAVEKPGAYQMTSDATILSVLALAGGTEWVSSAKNVKVFRPIQGGGKEEIKLNLARIRKNQDPNFKLAGGDFIFVGTSSVKSGVKAFWEYGLRLIFLPF